MKNLILLILPMFFFACSCESGNDPVDDLEPGRRDYMWETDTLDVPSGSYVRIFDAWGNRPGNIWACGDAYSSNYKLWHYNGAKWQAEQIGTYFMPKSIDGTAENDIWIAADRGEFWHYNGSAWSLSQKFTIDDYNELLTENIMDKSSEDIYSVGTAGSPTETIGIIMHYNGSIWHRINIPKINEYFLQMEYYARDKSHFIFSWDYAATSGAYSVYNLKEDEIFNVFPNGRDLAMGKVRDNIYLSDQQKVYKYDGGEFTIWKDFTGTKFLGRIWGRNENDIFCINFDGLGHYDGETVETIYPFSNGYITQIVVFLNDIFAFFIDNTNRKCIVIHGKLNG